MKNSYCQNCDDKVTFSIRRDVIKEYKGYKVNVEQNIAYCNKCGASLYIPEIENDNFEILYSRYREVSGTLGPDDIINLRNKYNISQRELTAILNWGKMTINRYENGSIPGTSHNDLLKLIISNESIFKEKVEEAYKEKRISLRTYEKINTKVLNNLDGFFKNMIIQSLTHKEDEFNGFRSFDYDKMINLISYIADNVNLYKTSLNKYLWYIDFMNFKLNVRSITGLRYIRYTHGPVIEDFKYEDILNYFDEKFYKDETEEDTSIITKIISKKNYDLSIFADDELEVINGVINLFKNKTSTEISNLSHKENAWIDNKDRELISYDYAEQLKFTLS